MWPLLLLVAFLLFPRARAGGFLVCEDFVMTAAHCPGSQISVILGAHNIRTLEGTQQRIPVLRPVPHPGYSPQSHSNDIMLLQLANRVQRNQFVRPVPLPQTQNRLRPGIQCTVADGADGLTGLNTRTDTLQCAQLRVQRDRLCSRRFISYNGQTQICVGDPRQRKSAFVGDSGGPLVWNNVAQGIIRRSMRGFKEWRPE
ncbi:hypothetical protein FD755_023738 [Muntiacus reevesi]|uniref:Peptidase S1 domain-containing protein n=1 Tax=Muntiacus reevesi TaxID=9886 RepID=A0A5N3VWH5_MUNRE|nr:hypothetical protein FD755_023738 [Muntiacus reevesi]